MIPHLREKGSANWILIVLLVIAIVLAICFYTQKRIIETERDNLAADIQSTKQTTVSLESSQVELEIVKKDKAELVQQLTVANDSIAQLQKTIDALKNQDNTLKKKTATTTKKTTAKPKTKASTKKTRK